MNKIFLLLIIIIIIKSLYAQNKTDANIFGHVIYNEEHIPFANIYLRNTNIGTSTDETGHYILTNVPQGEYSIVVRALGYKTIEKTVKVVSGKTIELNFDLEKDVLGIAEIVVSANRNEINRKETTVIVSTLNPKQFELTGSSTLNESLNFLSGLRIENNCQNCGFNQLRMNGMEGPYSQVLINSRAIFSGLAGVYGLELIPANMIERVEVVRGGGSSLYGSNAIAGTINIILKDPINNTYEFGVISSLIGIDKNYHTPAFEYNTTFNTSLISSDVRTGMALYAYKKNRNYFDANNDGFSELSKAKNLTVGTRLFHRINSKNKISLDYFSINEDRRGGNGFNNRPHMSDITEGAEHNINTLALNYDFFINQYNNIFAYASAQYIERDSYYGANRSLKDYGVTNDLTYNTGIQYLFNRRKINFLAGIEKNGSFLKDTKLGYLDIDNAEIFNDSIVNIPYTLNTVLANQMIDINAGFIQFENRIKIFKYSIGGRFDNYLIYNRNNDSLVNKGNVFSPRFNLLIDLTKDFQFRGSFSRGFRAPQIFDEDLHVETSGARQIKHVNSPDLKQEESYSLTASFDYRKTFKNVSFGFLAEGFFTKLLNPFVIDFGKADATGVVIYTRKNSESAAIVNGTNFELDFIYKEKFNSKFGFTLQKSFYEKPNEFNEKRFFRSPASYGYYTLELVPLKSLNISSTATYTGKMLVPYFGNTILNPEDGELRISKSFYEISLKAAYKIKINGASLVFSVGVKNIFNSYQKDFDFGIDRDPAYIYGPLYPRTLMFGVKIGNTI